MNSKAQSSIIGFLILVGIGLAVMVAVFGWAWPAMQQAQNQDDVMRLENRMIELHNAIKKAASGQGMLTVPFTIKKGTLYLDNNNSIIMKANYRLPQVYQNVIVLGNNTGGLGILGRDEPGYLVKRGSIEFALQYIYLNDTSRPDGKCYGIRLISGNQGAAGKGEHTVFVKWLNENTTSFTGCSSAVQETISIQIE